jgi:hypothetical protein
LQEIDTQQGFKHLEAPHYLVFVSHWPWPYDDYFPYDQNI